MAKEFNDNLGQSMCAATPSLETLKLLMAMLASDEHDRREQYRPPGGMRTQPCSTLACAGRISTRWANRRRTLRLHSRARWKGVGFVGG